MSAETILTAVRQYLEYDPTESVTLIPIQRGASGRTIVRVVTEEYEPFIGISWTDDRPDNDQFPAVGHFLKEQAGLNVADILFENMRWRVALVEDLGDTDLHSLKGAPWKDREPYYRSALEQLDRLFYCRAGKDVEFNPPFDTRLYRWEQDYFFDNMVEGILEMDSAPLRRAESFLELAERLGSGARNLVHRDFQSQNMMLHEGETWLIDFQGMRRGHQEYDLASLIFDPYMDHGKKERERLMDLWEDIADERPAEQIFRECAAQRLMQALGAYGSILRNRHDESYRPHIPVAARLLAEVSAEMPIGDLLAPVLERAMEVK